MLKTTEVQTPKTLEIHQIYDSIFKTALTLSSPAVIRFINSLYGMDYPMDSTITYNWTESHDRRLKRTLSDTILTVNGRDVYHLEGQMTRDNRIVFRVFQYGFQHAAKYIQKDEDGLDLPEPAILYFDMQKNIPAYQSMVVSVGSKQKFQYHVRTFCYQDYSMEELNERNMILFIPFQLLKYREIMNKAPSEENIRGLKRLIANDILGSIQSNYEAGNISYSDVVILKDMSRMLCEFLYEENEVCQEEGVIKMLAEPIIFESVVLRDHYEELIQELKEENQAVVAECNMRDVALAERAVELAERDEEIARLKALLGQAG